MTDKFNTRDYRNGYSDGWRDCYDFTQKYNKPYPGLPAVGPWPQFPAAPVVKCPLCGIDMSTPMQYCCSAAGCPMQPTVTCSESSDTHVGRRLPYSHGNAAPTFSYGSYNPSHHAW